MSAREVSENVRLTPRAKRRLAKFRRELAARVDANVAFSGAVEYALDVAEATLARNESRRELAEPFDSLDLWLRDIEGELKGGKS